MYRGISLLEQRSDQCSVVCKPTAARTHPTFVVESTSVIKMFKVFHVRLGSPEIQVADFKVGPKVAPIVCLTAVITQEINGVILRNVLRVSLNEFCKGKKV